MYSMCLVLALKENLLDAKFLIICNTKNILFLNKIFIFYFFVFLGPHPWHMEIPRLGIESEL